MKAVVLYGKEDVRLADFPVPEMTPTSVKVAVEWCGICGSDLHKFEGKKNTHPIHYPIPLGHEISGYVAEVGSDVKNFKVGDAVTVDPNWSCGHCYYCQKGQPSFCQSARGVVKGMGQYWVSPQENVYHLPKGLDLRTAALTEPLACCLHGMDLLAIRPGENVALVGFGAIGSMMLPLIRRAGAAKIVVAESNPDKREKALRMGATHFVDPRDEQAIDAIAAELNIDRVMECVGVSAAQQTALRLAGKGATVVFFGVSDEKDVLPLSVYEAFAKELTLKTSFVNPHTTQRAIEILSAGWLDPQEIIAKELAMDEVAEELKTRRYTRQGKVLVKIQR